MNQNGMYSPDQMDQFGPLFAIMAAVWGIILLFGIGIYILQATAFFKMFKKANVQHPWLAYIPIAQLWPFFWTIKKSAWNILWTLLPIAGAIVGGIIWGILGNHGGAAIFWIFFGGSSIVSIIISIIWMVRLFKAFGMSPLWLLGMIGSFIPIVNFLVNIGFIVLYCYIGFSRDVEYHPDFDKAA